VASIDNPWFFPHSSSSLPLTNKTASFSGPGKTERDGGATRGTSQTRENGPLDNFVEGGRVDLASRFFHRTKPRAFEHSTQKKTRPGKQRLMCQYFCIRPWSVPTSWIGSSVLETIPSKGKDQRVGKNRGSLPRCAPAKW